MDVLLNFEPTARTEQWVLHLQGFDYRVMYHPGKANIAALSRLNSISQPDKSGQQEDFVK